MLSPDTCSSTVFSMSNDAVRPPDATTAGLAVADEHKVPDVGHGFDRAVTAARPGPQVEPMSAAAIACGSPAASSGCWSAPLADSQLPATRTLIHPHASLAFPSGPSAVAKWPPWPALALWRAWVQHAAHRPQRSARERCSRGCGARPAPCWRPARSPQAVRGLLPSRKAVPRPPLVAGRPPARPQNGLPWSQQLPPPVTLRRPPPLPLPLLFPPRRPPSRACPHWIRCASS